MTVRRSMLLVAFAVGAACTDPLANQNANGEAVPVVAPPRLTPVEIRPPAVEQVVTGRVRVLEPPSVDATQVDLLRQSDGVVDILWVVDDSGSMANERARLQTNFSRFLQELNALKVDYQMGVASIDFSGGGRLRGGTKIITRTSSDPAQLFRDATTFPPSRNRWEMGLRMAEFALTPPLSLNENRGFVRSNAALAIIVVTNEDDSSFGTTDYYARAYRALKGKGNETLVSFSVIGGPTPNGCLPEGEGDLFGSEAEPSFRYSEVAALLNGVVGSICDQSFESTLIRIAQALNTLKRVFPLTLKPLLGSVRVTVDGVAIPEHPVTGFQYRADTNSVAFLGTYVPPPGATVRLEYAFSRS